MHWSSITWCRMDFRCLAWFHQDLVIWTSIRASLFHFNLYNSLCLYVCWVGESFQLLRWYISNHKFIIHVQHVQPIVTVTYLIIVSPSQQQQQFDKIKLNWKNIWNECTARDRDSKAYSGVYWTDFLLSSIFSKHSLFFGFIWVIVI